MSESCTIISESADRKHVDDVVSNLTLEEGFSVHRSSSAMDSIEVRSPEGALVFNCLIRGAPGDRFSKLVLGMHNYARKLDERRQNTKPIVLKTIANANMLVGVVANPGYSGNERLVKYLFAVAKGLNGLVFDGTAIMDAEGNTMLDK